MSSWFEDYEKTETGRNIAYIINRPDRMLEFRLLSKLGMPAVQAVAAEVAPIINALPDKRARDMASQFTGWRVGRRMRDAGYEVAKERGRVSNAPFKTGAVWRQVQRVQIVDGRRLASQWVAIELSVEEGEEWVCGHWIVAGHFGYTVQGDDMIESAFRDAWEYADRYGFSKLYVYDPENLFPKEDRARVLKKMGLDDPAPLGPSDTTPS